MKALTVILSPDSSLSIKEKQGTLSRLIKNMEIYSKHFDVHLYTCDARNYTRSVGVRHHHVPLLPKAPVLRHLFFYAFLILSSMFFKSGPIRVYGVSIPFVLLMRALSGNRVFVSYEWDYKEQAKEVYGGAKGAVAPLIEKLTIAGADIVLATNYRMRDKVKKLYRKRVFIVPLFIDMKDFRPSDRCEDYVLFAARLHWIKGLDFLLEAFSMLSKKGVRTKLYIAGDGDIRRYASKAKELGLDNVVFFGPVKNRRVGEMMRKSKCFVLPTITMEGQPVCLIEAMASGCACVVTDVPGINDMVDDGKTGILVPPRDSHALSCAIERVINDKKLRTGLRRNAIEYSKRHGIGNTLEREVNILSKT